MRGPVTHSLVRTLRDVPMFEAVDDSTLLDVVGSSATLFWPAGSTVFDVGETAGALYVVLSGEVDILDGDTPIATIEPGDHFGEHALLFGTDHTKRAQATSDTELMVVPDEPLRALLDANPTLADRVRRRAEERRARTRVEG